MKAKHTSEHKYVHWLLLLWLMALVGYFSPWISRQPFSAALNWNAYDLYDAVRLLPEIETGSIDVNLQTLRSPLLGLSILLVLHLTRSNFVIRVGGVFLSGALVVMTLPPYPIILTAWRTPGWLVPFWWAVVTGVFCVAWLWLFPRLRSFLPWMVSLVAAASVIPAVLTLNRLLPALRILHNAPVGKGWGFWLTELGILGYAVGFWVVGIAPRDDKVVGIIESTAPYFGMPSIRVVKARYEAQLLEKPNVIAVGIGLQPDNAEPVIVVSVTNKVPLDLLDEDQRVPKTLDGFAVRVQAIGEPTAQEGNV